MIKFTSSELCRSLGRLETHIINLSQNIVELKSSIDGVSDRVLYLERQYFLWRGGIGVLFALGASLGIIFELILRWYFR